MFTKNNAKTICILALMLVLSGCKTDEVQPMKNTKSFDQTYLFAITYDNHAWVETHKHIVIKNDGSVIYSENSPFIKSSLSNEIRYSEDELIQRFEYQFKTLGQVALSTLTEKFKLLSNVDSKRLSDHKSSCADFGSTRFWGLSYDHEKQSYRSVLLAEHGDNIRRSSDTKAIEIKNWLVDLAKESSLDVVHCQ